VEWLVVRPAVAWIVSPLEMSGIQKKGGRLSKKPRLEKLEGDPVNANADRAGTDGGIGTNRSNPSLENRRKKQWSGKES
jgi:hypothetical protein